MPQTLTLPGGCCGGIGSEPVCSVVDNHLPLVLEHTPIKQVNLIFHIFPHSGLGTNFTNSSDITTMVNTANSILENAAALSTTPTPTSSGYSLADTRIRWLLKDVRFHDETDFDCQEGDQSFLDNLYSSFATQTDDDKAIHVFLGLSDEFPIYDSNHDIISCESNTSEIVRGRASGYYDKRYIVMVNN